MRILKVENDIPSMEGDREESSLPTFPQKMNVMKDLQQLQLTHFSVPSWICGMENLTDHALKECSDYPPLQNLPNLQKLNLRDANCRELPNEFGESGGFPMLAKLVIADFPLLKELPVLEEEGVMQRLELLLIRNCPWVKRVPEGLERLRRLKRISLYEKVSGELEERLKKGGEDWNRI